LHIFGDIFDNTVAINSNTIIAINPPIGIPISFQFVSLSDGVSVLDTGSEGIAHCGLKLIN